jgi:hypothetical protein
MEAELRSRSNLSYFHTELVHLNEAELVHIRRLTFGGNCVACLWNVERFASLMRRSFRLKDRERWTGGVTATA